MINKTMLDAINKQINAELVSAYLYLSMAAWLFDQNYLGMAHWMLEQDKEERKHAMKFFDFINDRDGQVALDAIEKPASGWDSPLAIFEATYKHELKVTGLINNLMRLAIEEKDYAAVELLQGFAREQVEEESIALSIVQLLELAKDNVAAILDIDRDLGKRGA